MTVNRTGMTVNRTGDEKKYETKTWCMTLYYRTPKKNTKKIFFLDLPLV